MLLAAILLADLRENPESIFQFLLVVFLASALVIARLGDFVDLALSGLDLFFGL